MNTFEISNGSLTFVPLMITIPIPFLIIGSVLIAVFLFVSGVTNNSKVETPIPNRKVSSELENTQKADTTSNEFNKENKETEKNENEEKKKENEDDNNETSNEGKIEKSNDDLEKK